MLRRTISPSTGAGPHTNFDVSLLWFPISAIACACFLGSAILYFERNSDRYNIAQLRLVELLSTTDRIGAMEAGSVARLQRAANEARKRELYRLISQSNRQIAELRLLTPEPDELSALDHELSSYIQSMNVSDGAPGKSPSSNFAPNSLRVDQFNRLRLTLQQAIARITSRVDSTNAAADTFTMACLIAGALLVSALFIGYRRALNQAMLGKQSELHYLNTLLANTSDAIGVVNSKGEYIYMSPVVQKIAGYEHESIDGKNAFEFAHPEDLKTIVRFFENTLANPGTFKIEIRARYADGEYHPIEIIANNLMDDPAVSGILVTYHDLTERNKFNDQLRHHALHDSLTGLPNRALCMDRINQAVARTARSKSLFAVLFLDLDNFKSINDSFGHSAGDELLKGIGSVLQASVRADDTVARLGGDEYVVVIENLKTKEDANRVASHILEQLQKPISANGHEIFWSVSIGAVICESAKETAEDLIHRADVAMYHVKSHGKGGFIFYDDSMDNLQKVRMEIEADLHHALERDEFKLMYQPIIDMGSQLLVGVEALVRWDNPRLGLLMPDRFIPIAEEIGMIVPLGRWVLEQACRQHTAWSMLYRLDPPITMSVNLSSKELRPSLVNEVSDVLQITGMPPEQLKLEITESSLVVNLQETAGILGQLRGLGVQVAIDDFGTGFSSMSYLNSLPVDILKIDKAFISKLGQVAATETIVRSIIDLAQSLHMKVVCEGIESASQSAQVKTMGSDLGQGNYYSKPVTDAAVGTMIADRIKARPSKRP